MTSLHERRWQIWVVAVSIAIAAGVSEALAGVPASLIGVTLAGIGLLNYVVGAWWRR